MRILSDNRLSARAREFFGGDVQRFHIEGDGRRYRIVQTPHCYPLRTVAEVYAMTAREAVRMFNAMARCADRSHA